MIYVVVEAIHELTEYEGAVAGRGSLCSWHKLDNRQTHIYFTNIAAMWAAEYEGGAAAAAAAVAVRLRPKTAASVGRRRDCSWYKLEHKPHTLTS